MSPTPKVPVTGELWLNADGFPQLTINLPEGETIWVQVPTRDAMGNPRTSRAAARLAEDVHRGFQGVHPDDVALCLELDRFPFAMVAASEGSLMVLRPHAMPAPTGEGPV